MNRENLLTMIKKNILEIFPELSVTSINETDSLKDLGANSIDRAEIIMLTLMQLKLKTALMTFASASNIGDLIEIFHQELQIHSC